MVKEYKHEVAIPLEVVKAQTQQIIEYGLESGFEIDKVKIKGFNMVLYSNSEKSRVQYFEHLLNTHIKNINKLEKCVCR